MPEQLIDHLFRHQFGKMVSILTKIFGFQHLETIEDAVQDTFIQAMRAWRNEIPANPEAWLTAAAKNRVIDIFRTISAEKARSLKSQNPISTVKLEELFLDHEIEDSQLRMIFTACHPRLAAQEQIAFSLKTISGFSTKEIAAALLAKEDTIKKRLQRARKSIADAGLKLEIPGKKDLPLRIDRVLEVIYVIFNEGFHSNKKNLVIRKDLCGEAIRLLKLILKKPNLRSSKVYALFALMCFLSARLESKVNERNELIPLSKQDRSSWYFPLIAVGNDAMYKAVENEDTFSTYHYEAAIAAEHLRAPNFESTNWKAIAQFYEKLSSIQPSANTSLNLAVVYLQLNDLSDALRILESIKPSELVQQEYLYHATFAEYHHLSKNKKEAIKYIDRSLELTQNESEHHYLSSKKHKYISMEH